MSMNPNRAENYRYRSLEVVLDSIHEFEEIYWNLTQRANPTRIPSESLHGEADQVIIKRAQELLLKSLEHFEILNDEILAEKKS